MCYKEIMALNLICLELILHLRMDQDADDLKIYWSKQLGIPINQFNYVAKDAELLASQRMTTIKVYAYWIAVELIYKEN
jgi:hypothetical protein